MATSHPGRMGVNTAVNFMLVSFALQILINPKNHRKDVQQSTDPKTELLRSLGITAFYGYPLIAQGRFLGTLSFGSWTRLSFTNNQKGMMQAVCDQIAIAMERSNLIASLQKQTEQLQEANRMKDEFLGIYVSRIAIAPQCNSGLGATPTTKQTRVKPKWLGLRRQLSAMPKRKPS